MTKEFCDRCGKDVNGKRSGSVHGVRDAAADGNGTITDNFDIICPKCYSLIIAFIRTASAVVVPKRRRSRPFFARKVR